MPYASDPCSNRVVFCAVAAGCPRKPFEVSASSNPGWQAVDWALLQMVQRALHAYAARNTGWQNQHSELQDEGFFVHCERAPQMIGAQGGRGPIAKAAEWIVDSKVRCARARRARARRVQPLGVAYTQRGQVG